MSVELLRARRFKKSRNALPDLLVRVSSVVQICYCSCRLAGFSRRSFRFCICRRVPCWKHQIIAEKMAVDRFDRLSLKVTDAAPFCLICRSRILEPATDADILKKSWCKTHPGCDYHLHRRTAVASLLISSLISSLTSGLTFRNLTRNV